MEVWGKRGKKESIYLSLHCHHQNDLHLRWAAMRAILNVSLIVRDKVTRLCPQTTTFEEKGEPKRYRTEVLPLTSLLPTARPNRLSRLHLLSPLLLSAPAPISPIPLQMCVAVLCRFRSLVYFRSSCGLACMVTVAPVPFNHCGFDRWFGE